MTTAADDPYIVLWHLLNRHLTVAATGRQYGIHPQTNRNRLRQNIQPSCIPTILWSNSHLSSNGKAELVCRHLHFCADWDLILFSHECGFNLNHADGCQRVYCSQGEHFADACFIERDCFRRCSSLSMGCHNGRKKTLLIVINGNINAQTYINDVLASPNVTTFMHDNAHPH